MINADIREYSYFTYGENNAYGQPILSAQPQGTVKMAIYLNTQAVQESNIKYKDCDYIGMTHDANVDDTYVIEYGKERLKVSYVNPGRFKQVLLVRI